MTDTRVTHTHLEFGSDAFAPEPFPKRHVPLKEQPSP